MIRFWLILRNFAAYVGWKTTASTPRASGEIRLHGARIYYVVHGTGPPVLLLHGGLSNRLSWFSQIPFLIQAGRQVILVDTRGHGQSTLGAKPLSYSLFADDVVQVLDHLNISQTDVIGWSDGGIIALILAHRQPQRVRRMVAISANFHPSGLVEGATETGRATGIRQWLRKWWSGAGKEYVQLEAGITQLWATEPRFDPEELQSIQTPTLVIVGEQDMITQEHSAELAEGLADGRLTIIAGAGHAAPITDAQTVNILLQDFLD
ncbi:MAG TPA: alpha/beta hydrolase [Alcaligenaceae bacterium]|nr:alpha/beta hydrolase [Alcaligenaceae bacterium]